MLDEALRSDVPVGRDLRALTDDEARGLRILFGTHPDYRTEPSPVVRREEASEYLVPGWRALPPKNRAGTFQRRHQARALRIALEHLRARYGQQDRALARNTDVVRQRRWWVVDARRQVSLVGDSELLRCRADRLGSLTIYEARHTAPGFVGSRFELRQHPLGTAVKLVSIEDAVNQPSHRALTFELPGEHLAGDLVGIEWEEYISFGPEVTQWESFYVATQSPNDGFVLELSVRFFSEPPEIVWHFVSDAFVDETLLEPETDKVLSLDHEGVARYAWLNAERRLDYGIKWQWE